MPTLLIILFLIILAVILTASAIAFTFFEKQRKKQVTGMLRTVSGEVDDDAKVSLLIEQNETDVLSSMLQRRRVGKKLQASLSQSGLGWDAKELVIAMFILGAIGFLLGFKFNVLILPWVSCFGLAFVMGSLPYAYVRFKRRQRMAEFEEQFPEALDFLARSMRAGHAFSVSLEMLGEESPEPLGREFRTLFNEQNLGASIDLALANFAERVPHVDVRFFVSAVMLQKQTGGNLSEILTRLGYIIRERFQLRGKVKAVSAHARITAAILRVMPIFLAIALYFVAPGYLQGLARDPDGKYLLLGSVLAQIVGYFVIRRIIDIKV